MGLTAPSTLEPWGKALPSPRARAVPCAAAISCTYFIKQELKGSYL